MSIQDPHKLLQQQIGLARLHLASFEAAASLPATRAGLQATLLALELGILSYMRDLFDDSSLTSVADCRGISSEGDYRRQEILNLVKDDNSWLSFMGRLVSSLQVPAKGLGLSVPEPAGGGLIASSSDKQTELHWTSLSSEQLRALVESCDAIRQRHASYDQEY